jgi:hypothetical protein
MKRYFCIRLKKFYEDEKEIFIDRQNVVFVEINKKDGNINYCQETIKSYFKKYEPFGIEEIFLEEYEEVKKNPSTRVYELSKIHFKDSNNE